MTNREIFAVCWERYKQTRLTMDGAASVLEEDSSGRGDRHLVSNAEYNADFHRAAKVALPFTVAPETHHDRHINRLRRLYELHVIQDWAWPEAVSLLVLCDCLPGVECKCWERRQKMRPQGDYQAAKWWDEIQDRVGLELRDSGVWPLRRYFTEPGDGGKQPYHPRVTL